MSKEDFIIQFKEWYLAKYNKPFPEHTFIEVCIDERLNEIYESRIDNVPITILYSQEKLFQFFLQRLQELVEFYVQSQVQPSRTTRFRSVPFPCKEELQYLLNQLNG